MTNLLPCPFCSSTNIDAKGWASTDRSGPACGDCAGTADTVEIWNTRPAPVGWKLVPTEPTTAMLEIRTEPLLRLGEPTLPRVQQWRQALYIAMVAASPANPGQPLMVEGYPTVLTNRDNQ